jgi:hypothetical protein
MTVHPFESNEEYHANPAISSTTAKHVLVSEQLLYDHLHKLTPRNETKSMSLGTAIHCAMLETGRFKREYVVRPDGLDGRSSEGKEWRKKSGGKHILSRDDSAAIDMILARMPEAVWEVLECCEKEVSYRVPISDDMEAQCRFDAINRNMGLAYDLKTTSSFDWFDRDVVKYRYDFSAGWYNWVYQRSAAVPLASFTWLVVETTWPFRVDLVEIPEEVLDDCTRFVDSLIPTIIRVNNGFPTEPPLGRQWRKPVWHDIRKGTYGD